MDLSAFFFSRFDSYDPKFVDRQVLVNSVVQNQKAPIRVYTVRPSVCIFGRITVWQNYIWAASWQNQQSGTCAQRRLRSAWAPGHPPSLIRGFAVRNKKACVLSYPLSAQRRLIRLGRCPGWSESSLGALSFCWFCHVVAHFSNSDYYSNFLAFFPAKLSPVIYLHQQVHFQFYGCLARFLFIICYRLFWIYCKR